MIRVLVTVLTVFLIGTHLQAASLENVPAGEAAITKKIAAGIAAGVRKQFSENPSLATRDAHAKAHGCVKGEFTVNSNLPAVLKTQVFQAGAVYPAWIRYSNGSGKSDNDSVGDGRGMAIKLMGVQGNKLANEKYTQDFLMINHPVFFVRTAQEYPEFSAAVASGNPFKFFFPGLDPRKWRLHEVKIARAIQSSKVEDLLATRFFSMTPYLYGDRAVKFSAKPCFTNDGERANTKSPNFLRETLASHLTKRDGCFEFGVQFQRGSVAMPVEDPTIEWSEKTSPFVKVATLKIPRQKFTSDKQQSFCEHISLNPWHAVEEHRPLGGINRVRKVVYETISNLRHELNREPLIEPTGNESF